MKLSQKMNEAINKQINEELHSSYIYLAFAGYFEGETLSGFAHWMKKQAQEEVNHAMKFYSFIYERGGSVTFEDIKKAPATPTSPLDAFEKSYEHEMHITKTIDELAALAEKMNDRPTREMLSWFIDEQVEEENNALSIVEMLKKIGSSTQGLVMLDRELGSRK